LAESDFVGQGQRIKNIWAVMLTHFGDFCVSGIKVYVFKINTAHLFTLMAEVGDVEIQSVGYANPQQLNAWM